MGVSIGELTGTISADDRFSQAFENLVHIVERGVGELESSFGTLAIGATAVATAVIGAASAIVSLGIHGSEINDVKEGFDRLAGGVQNATDILDAMRTGVAGTINDFDLMKDANKALASGAIKTAEQFGEMTTAARVLSREGFGPIPSLMSTIERALTTGRVRSLQYITGVIDLAGAETKYAATLNKTRAELTPQQKLLADQTAVYARLNEKVKEAGVQQLNFAEKITAARTAVTNWFNNLTSTVAASPHVNAALDAMGAAIMKAFGGSAQTMLDTIVSWVNKFADGVTHWGPIIIGWMADIVTKVEEIWAAVQKAWDSVPDWFKKIALEAGETALAVGAVSIATTELTGSGILSNLASLAQIYSTWGTAAKDAAIAVQAFFATFLELGAAAALSTHFPAITKWLAALPGMFTEATGPVTAFAAAIFDLSNPIGWLIGAITILGGGLRLLTGDWDFVLKPIAAVWQALKDIATVTGAVIGWFADKLQPVLQDIGTLFDAVGGFISDVFVVALQAAKPWLASMWEYLKETVPLLKGFILAFQLLHGEAESIRNAPKDVSLPDTRADDALRKAHLANLASAGATSGTGFIAGGHPDLTDPEEATKKSIAATNKSIDETAKIWDGYFKDLGSRSGGIYSSIIADIQRTYETEKDTLDKSKKDNANYYNQLTALNMAYEEQRITALLKYSEKTIEESRKTTITAQEAVANSMSVGTTMMSQLAQAKAAANVIPTLPLTNLSDTFKNLSSTTMPQFMTVMHSWGSTAVQEFTKAERAAHAFKMGIVDALMSIPDILIAAFEGGGGLLGALKAIAVQIGSVFYQELVDSFARAAAKAKADGVKISGVGVSGTDKASAGFAGAATTVGVLASGGSTKAALGSLASTTASVVALTIATHGLTAASLASAATIGAWTFGIGAAAIGAYILIRHFVTVSKEVKAARIEVKNFEDEIIKTLSVTQLNEAGTERWKAIVIGVRDQYLKLGLTAAQAEKDVQALFDAASKGAKATANAIDLINTRIQIGQAQQALAAAKTDLAKQQLTNANTILNWIHDQAEAWRSVTDEIKKADKAWKDAGKTGKDTSKDYLELLRKQKEAVTASADEMKNLGIIAVASFNVALANGVPFFEALSAIAPGLVDLQSAFDALGITSENAFLRTLTVEAQVLQNNPTLVAGIGAVADSFAALIALGDRSTESFRGLEETGLAMYTKLQASVAAVGGGTKEALLPMQDFLHKAEKAALDLGIPLDANTQMLIDQSKELGIWKEAGKSATDKMIEAMNALIAAVQALIDHLNHIPDANATVHINYDDPGAPNYDPTPDYGPGAGNGYYDSDGIWRPNTGGVTGRATPPTVPQAAGGYGHASGPMNFSTKGNEDYIFSGEGKSFGDMFGSNDSYDISVTLVTQATNGQELLDEARAPGGFFDKFIEEVARNKRGRGKNLRRAVEAQ